MKPFSKIAWGCAIAMAFIGAISWLILGMISKYVDDPFDRREFNSSAWIRSGSYDRAGMTRDLLKRLRSGMNKEEITELLGKPTTVVDSAPGSKSLISSKYEYYLGSWPQAYDSCFLWIYYDAHGKLIRAEIGGY
jgi:hypothetical protein